MKPFVTGFFCGLLAACFYATAAAAIWGRNGPYWTLLLFGFVVALAAVAGWNIERRRDG